MKRLLTYGSGLFIHEAAHFASWLLNKANKYKSAQMVKFKFVQPLK